jgi:hypothetical protein
MGIYGQAVADIWELPTCMHAAVVRSGQSLTK